VERWRRGQGGQGGKGSEKWKAELEQKLDNDTLQV